MMTRIAVPNKGRLCQPTLDLLNKAGFKCDGGAGLYARCGGTEILFSRAADIPEFVADGAADLGVTGFDVVEESGAKLSVLLKLGFGGGSLVVAVPQDSGIKKIKDIKAGAQVATSYPNITAKFFKSVKKKVEVVEVSGACEVAPTLGVADLIVDITSSGDTLAKNNLKVIDTVMDTEAVLVGRPKMKSSQVVLALKSVLDAASRRYLMLNVEKKNLKKVAAVIPGLESPTVLDLAKPGFVAVHSVVDEAELSGVISELKKLGCKDILVLPIERLVS